MKRKVVPEGQRSLAGGTASLRATPPEHVLHTAAPRRWRWNRSLAGGSSAPSRAGPWRERKSGGCACSPEAHRLAHRLNSFVPPGQPAASPNLTRYLQPRCGERSGSTAVLQNASAPASSVRIREHYLARRSVTSRLESMMTDLTFIGIFVGRVWADAMNAQLGAATSQSPIHPTREAPLFWASLRAAAFFPRSRPSRSAAAAPSFPHLSKVMCLRKEVGQGQVCGRRPPLPAAAATNDACSSGRGLHRCRCIVAKFSEPGPSSLTRATACHLARGSRALAIAAPFRWGVGVCDAEAAIGTATERSGLRIHTKRASSTGRVLFRSAAPLSSPPRAIRFSSSLAHHATRVSRTDAIAVPLAAARVTSKHPPTRRQSAVTTTSMPNVLQAPSLPPQPLCPGPHESLLQDPRGGLNVAPLIKE